MSIHGMYPKHGFYIRYAFQASNNHIWTRNNLWIVSIITKYNNNRRSLWEENCTFQNFKEQCTKKAKKKIESKCPCGKILTSSSVLLFKDVVDFLKGLSPNELTGVRELQRRDLLHRASIYVNMVDNNSLDNYGKFFLMFFFYKILLDYFIG